MSSDKACSGSLTIYASSAICIQPFLVSLTLGSLRILLAFWKSNKAYVGQSHAIGNLTKRGMERRVQAADGTEN